MLTASLGSFRYSSASWIRKRLTSSRVLPALWKGVLMTWMRMIIYTKTKLINPTTVRLATNGSMLVISKRPSNATTIERAKMDAEGIKRIR